MDDARTYNRTSTAQPADRNIRTIAELERRALQHRTVGDRLSDAITRLTGSAVFAGINLAFFAGWLAANSGVIPGVKPFDPFPFNLLTLVVSLEAIFLAIFVLMSQNRAMRDADKRAHLDLQVDLLAEQELTRILQMLDALCTKLQVGPIVPPQELKQFEDETDVDKLASAIEDRLGAR